VPLRERPKGKPKPGAGAAVVAGELGKDLDAMVLGFDRDDGGFSGAVLVARGGTVVIEKGYGLHDAAAKERMRLDALWDWASVSKQFTAAALLKLQDTKKLKLDDAVPKHWPKAPADKKDVTLRHLLSHTSGIQSGFRKEWEFDSRQRTSFEDLVLNLPMESKPGDKFDYSNSATRSPRRSSSASRAGRSRNTASRSCSVPRG
jgi:CubicO group peptidase (beta-lactamase class C family)